MLKNSAVAPLTLQICLPVCQTRLKLLSVVCPLRGVLFPGTVYTCNQGPLVKHLSPLLLCTQCLHPLKMLLLPTPVRQTAHGNSPELCRRSSPVPQIMIFVFPAFTLNPFSSIASFHVKSFLTSICWGWDK